jgi:hypothetical protein
LFKTTGNKKNQFGGKIFRHFPDRFVTTMMNVIPSFCKY